MSDGQLFDTVNGLAGQRFRTHSYVRSDAPDTSQEAAQKSAPLSSLARRRVYSMLSDSGESGMTDEEIQTALGMNPNTQRPRRKELCESGMITDSGRRRKTRSGSNAIVWVATNQVEVVA